MKGWRVEPAPTKAAGAQTTPPRTTPANPSGSQTNPGSATNPTTPAGPSVMTRLDGWLAELNATSVTKSTARRILGDLEPLQGGLSGTQLAESFYVAMIANSVLEDEDGSCRAARQVMALHRDAQRKAIAKQIVDACP